MALLGEVEIEALGPMTDGAAELRCFNHLGNSETLACARLDTGCCTYDPRALLG